MLIPKPGADIPKFEDDNKLGELSDKVRKAMTSLPRGGDDTIEAQHKSNMKVAELITFDSKYAMETTKEVNTIGLQIQGLLDK